MTLPAVPEGEYSRVRLRPLPDYEPEDAGRRSVGQLRTLLPDDAFEGVLTRLRTLGPGHRHAVRSMRTCYPVPTAVEVTVVIDHRAPTGQERVLAAAARFERHLEEWLCK